ncbi:hypothetical protein ABH924_001005 [Arthrobacter sp. GAS37]
METLTIKTPADVLSFIGHTLGIWPQESLVRTTLDTSHIGVSLRVALPKHDDFTLQGVVHKHVAEPAMLDGSGIPIPCQRLETFVENSANIAPRQMSHRL